MSTTLHNALLFSLLFILVSLNTIAQEVYTLKKEKELTGLVDSKNKWVIPALYSEIQEPLPHFYAVRNPKGLWGFFTTQKKITECLYNNFRFVSNERIIVQQNRRWGLINAEGKELIPFRYRYINPDKNNTYKVRPYNQWTARTFENKIIFTLEFDSIEYLGDNIYKFCLAGTYGLADQNGNIITTENQDSFEATLERKKPKKEFARSAPIIPKGDYKIPLEEKYDTVYHFSEGLAKFKTYGKYGFVDSLGNIRLVPQYSNARNFSEGMVAVMLMGKWGFMNTNEVLCVQPYYDEVSDFKNGIALVRKEKKYNFVDKKGNYIYGDFFDLIQPTYSGRYILVRHERYGMADEFGREFISTKYEHVSELGNSYILAKEHRLWGVLNSKGDIVIPFNYSVAQYDPEHNRMITMEPGNETLLSIE